jgi:glutamate-ammonia-ligase adenylyltransferase
LPAGTPAPDWGAIRAFKYRGLLRISARDALARSFAQSPGELSALADACLCAALDCAASETGAAAPCMLALGKLGGYELNFSSDVDLVFVYEARDDAEDLARNAELAPFVRTLKRGLESPAEDGFAYRVDLDLRPEGAQGALVNSVDAALTYYEGFGADWERQALIRLRVVGGERAAGEAFLRGIEPFVFRRLIDPGVTRGVRAMKLRIEDERLRAGRDLEADLKEGPGGIRDVEFFVQAFQLVFGGRHPELRGGSVLDVLARLNRLGLLPDGPAAELSEAYTWLRRAEHALQWVEERQTQRFPRDASQQLGLARRMGYRDPEGTRARDRLLDDWVSTRARVRGHFDALLVGEDA